MKEAFDTHTFPGWNVDLMVKPLCGFGFFLYLLVTTGCGTVVRVGFDNTPDPCKKEMSYVYGGVKLDNRLICEASSSAEPSHKLIIPFALADIPFSAVADTLILPYANYLDGRTELECARKNMQYPN